MKFGVALILAGLMLFSGVIAIAADGIGPMRGYDLGSVGELAPERDDMGPDWIAYDDNRPSGLIISNNQYTQGYWSVVTFTPVSQFALHAIRILPLNQGPNGDAHFYARVYSLDDDGNLDEMLQEFVEEDPPDFAQDAFITFQFDHDEELLEFEADEDFAVIYYSPGGPYNVGQNGAGWWNLYDGANDENRSFYIVTPSDEDNNGEPEDPETDLGEWRRSGGDFLVRANGEYLEDFIDLEVVEVYAEDGLYMTTPGTEQTFTADILNNGGAVEFYVVSFSVQNSDGDVVWENQVVVEEIEEEGEASISAEEPWVTPEDLGNYTVWVILEVDEDANADNNQGGLDQVVFDPADDEGNDMWLGYNDGEFETNTAWNEDSGWGVAFYHPGGDVAPMRIDGFRVNVINDDGDAHELEFAVHMLNLEEGFIDLRWDGTAELPEEEDAHWVEVDLSDWGNEEDADGNVLFEGEAWMVTYFFQDGTRFPIDGSPPWAGTNDEMPTVMLETGNDGGGYGPSGAGDYPIEVKMSETDAPRPGVHMEITPEELAFVPDNFDGEELMAGQDYVIEATFAAVGDEAVEIDEIILAPSVSDYITVEPLEDFSIEPGEEVAVTVTFRCEEEDLDENGVFEPDSRLLIRSNLDAGVVFWEFSAYIGPLGVTENKLPGVPDHFELSQNHPNPFNPTTSIDFALAKSGAVVFAIFDMNGRMVQEVINREMPAGYHSVTIDAHDLAAGVYMYQLSADEFVSSHKMVLIK